MNLQRTPYDLHWRMFGIPVRVHPTYWLISLFFLNLLERGAVGLFFIAIACVFVAVLAHELGHALMFRAYRMDAGILLYFLGGLAIPDGRLPRRSWRIIVSLAGPLTNFLLLGILWGSNYVQPWALEHPYLTVTYVFLFDINLFLGLINLLPVWPLDGGKISRELWEKYDRRDGSANSLRMSIAAAIGFAAYAVALNFNWLPHDWIVWWLRPSLFTGIFFAILAINNYQELQMQRGFGYRDDRPPWGR